MEISIDKMQTIKKKTIGGIKYGGYQSVEEENGRGQCVCG